MSNKSIQKKELKTVYSQPNTVFIQYKLVIPQYDEVLCRNSENDLRSGSISILLTRTEKKSEESAKTKRSTRHVRTRNRFFLPFRSIVFRELEK